MKKIILLSVCMLSGIFILVSFSSKKEPTTLMERPAITGIINCPPPAAAPVLITTAAFKAKYELNPVRVRKNVDLLTQAEINAIKVGIIKMKALPYTNPTSWLYQAAIHGTTLTDNMASWNTCHRVGEEFFFLAWHRMYVYFFERILRAKSGRADLTVPYWDYAINPVLHPAFRDNSLGNPLYTNRNSLINNGGALPSSIMTAFANAMQNIPFYTYQNSQLGPHGSVHTTVNGDMAIVSTAAKDPVFWLHHCDIDRMWEEWLNKCNGRANPIDTAWANKTFTFFDENGTAVAMNGSQLVEIATQLNYKYDNLPDIPNCPASRTTLVSRNILIRKAAPVEIRGQSQKTDFVQESPNELESFMRRTNRRTFNFASRPTPTSGTERLVMIFEDVRIDQLPQGALEVYLNLPLGVTPLFTSDNFVGLMDLFSAQHSAHGSSAGDDTIELDATKAAQALGLTLSDLRRATVSFYARGATLNGVQGITEAQVSIRRITFAVDQYE